MCKSCARPREIAQHLPETHATGLVLEEGPCLRSRKPARSARLHAGRNTDPVIKVVTLLGPRVGRSCGWWLSLLRLKPRSRATLRPPSETPERQRMNGLWLGHDRQKMLLWVWLFERIVMRMIAEDNHRIGVGVIVLRLNPVQKSEHQTRKSISALASQDSLRPLEWQVGVDKDNERMLSLLRHSAVDERS